MSDIIVKINSSENITLSLQGGGGAGGKQYLTFQYEPVAEVNANIIDGFIFDEFREIIGITLIAGDAPIGSALIVSIEKNGAASGSIATLADGETYQKTSGLNIAFTKDTDRFGLKITQTGSTNAGSRITAIVHF